MLIADIKGKLSLKERTSEDFLTSAVFSTFKYINSQHINEFLAHCKNINNNYLKIELKNPEFEFWPWNTNKNERVGGAEPDLIIYSEDLAVIIEAKNYSKKSGRGIIEITSDDDSKTQDYYVADQLAREYHIGLNKIAQGEIRDFILIYLTRDVLLPSKEIRESLNSIKLSKKEKLKSENRIYWINWQKAYLIFERITNNTTTDSFEFKLCSDLVTFLEKRDLDTFSGFDFSEIQFASKEFITKTNQVLKDNLFYKQRKDQYWTGLKSTNIQDIKDEYIFYSVPKYQYWNLKETEELPSTLKSIFYA